MVARSRLLAPPLVALLALVAAACERVPLVAPTGSTIVLTAPTIIVSTTDSIEIVAQVIEAAGTPPHSGTHVTFATTLGRIEPTDAVTDATGRASARFSPNGASGTATITASSGGASTGNNGLKVSVGSGSSIGSVRVSANPTSLSAVGGSTTIVATVVDTNGSLLVQVPVRFTTTAGSLSASVVDTDSAGAAQTVLTTTQEATVTATVAQGGSSGSGMVTVTLNRTAALAVSPPATH
jgi:adhesin/invasin